MSIPRITQILDQESIRVEYTANQTATAVITPPQGFRVRVRKIITHADINTGIVTIEFATSNQLCHKHYVALSPRAETAGGHVTGDTDEALSITSTTGSNELFVAVEYSIVN